MRVVVVQTRAVGKPMVAAHFALGEADGVFALDLRVVRVYR
jgi:hypothetical protein